MLFFIMHLYFISRYTLPRLQGTRSSQSLFRHPPTPTSTHTHTREVVKSFVRYSFPSFLSTPSTPSAPSLPMTIPSIAVGVRASATPTPRNLKEQTQSSVLPPASEA